MTQLRIEKHPDCGYLLTAECVVARPIDEVFEFFANASNLERLTPRWMRFSIVTPQPIAMRRGATIDYRLRVHGAPLRWQSEITAWEPPRRFVDEQRRGPYTFWRHEHRFAPCREGTRVVDEVHYGVPLGRLMHALFVRRDLEAIFRFRQAQLADVFPNVSAGAVAGA